MQLKNPSRFYNTNYRVFVGFDVQVMWAEPFLDLSAELAKMTRVVMVENIGIFTSNRSLEEEITCFAPP